MALDEVSQRTHLLSLITTELKRPHLVVDQHTHVRLRLPIPLARRTVRDHARCNPLPALLAFILQRMVGVGRHGRHGDV